MPLESATYINQLNSANPAPTDQISQGDDHIRLVKAVLKSTFPNITGAVTLTHDDLNDVPTAFNASSPIGLIAMWYGNAASIPVGWAECNGATVDLSDGSGTITTPDLRGKIVIGAGSLVPYAASYGAGTATATSAAGGSHSHTITADGAHSHNGATAAGHALTISEMPAHKHLNGIRDDATTTLFTRGTGPTALSGSSGVDAAGQTGSLEGYTETVGSGNPHTHNITFSGTDGTHSHTVAASADHTHSVTVSTYQPSLGLHYIMRV